MRHNLGTLPTPPALCWSWPVLLKIINGVQREMLALGEAGYKEVTLLGQNIDAYGRDLPGAAADGSGRRAWTFTDLLHYVHDVPGIERIRFATSHPRSATRTWHPSVLTALAGLAIKS